MTVETPERGRERESEVADDRGIIYPCPPAFLLKLLGTGTGIEWWWLFLSFFFFFFLGGGQFFFPVKMGMLSKNCHSPDQNEIEGSKDISMKIALTKKK